MNQTGFVGSEINNTIQRENWASDFKKAKINYLERAGRAWMTGYRLKEFSGVMSNRAQLTHGSQLGKAWERRVVPRSFPAGNGTEKQWPQSVQVAMEQISLKWESFDLYIVADGLSSKVLSWTSHPLQSTSYIHGFPLNSFLFPGFPSCVILKWVTNLLFAFNAWSQL